MGSKYPVLKPNEIINALRKLGFEVVSQKGSHIKLKKDCKESRIAIIPNHYEVAKSILKAILEQAGVTLDEFIKVL